MRVRDGSLGGWRVFIVVWCGQFCSWLGSSLTAFALGVYLFERSASPSLYAVSVVALVLPRIVLAPLAGPLVDRWDRRVVIILSDSLAAGVTMALVVLAWQESLTIWQIYLAITLNAACATFQRPAYAASVTQLIPAQDYGRANGLVQLARSSADLLAPALAGYLSVALGLGAILLIDLASFAVALVSSLLVRFPELQRETASKQQEDQAPSIWREATAGWRYLRQAPGLLALLLYTGAANFLGITSEVLLTPYVLSIADAIALGWVASAGGAGLVVGAGVLSIWGGPRRRLRGVFGFELLVCACTLLIGVARTPQLLVAIVFVYFVAVALSDGCATALWQEQVAPDVQGRVFALREMVSYSALPLGLIVFAPLAEYGFAPVFGAASGIAMVFLLAGTVNVLIIAVAWFYWQKHRRTLVEPA
jgi:MFS family permease